MAVSKRKVCVPKPRALVADDEWHIVKTLEVTFVRAGYQVVACTDGEEAAQELLDDGHFDIAVLDVGMPKMDGYEVLRRIRRRGVKVPVIMVSGRIREVDPIRGLNLGADDFVAKPFSCRELLARSAAVRRRYESTHALPKKVRIGEVVADFEVQEARRGAKELYLTPTEWRLLRHMAYRDGRVVSRAECNVRVLRIPASIRTRTMDRHAYALRCKLDKDAKNPRHILSVKGVGYRLNNFECLR